MRKEPGMPVDSQPSLPATVMWALAALVIVLVVAVYMTVS